MVKGETIEQKAHRLMGAAFRIKQPFNLDAPAPYMYSVSIFNVERLVELAIAEEREACKAECIDFSYHFSAESKGREVLQRVAVRLDMKHAAPNSEATK